MRTIFRTIVALLLGTMASSVAAEGYKLLPEENLDLDHTEASWQEADLLQVATLSEGAVSLTTLDPAELRCDSPPSLQDVLQGQSLSHTKVADTQLTASLGFPILSASANATSSYYITDVTHRARCVAQDGETALWYGFGYRIAISLGAIERSASLDYAIIAADATLNQRRAEIYSQAIGVSNREFISLLHALSTQINLDVETYSDFQEGMRKVASDFATLSDESDLHVRRLGIAYRTLDAFSSSIVQAFAIKQLAKGRACAHTLSKVPDSLANQVREVYATFTSQAACSDGDVTRAQREAAKEALADLL